MKNVPLPPVFSELESLVSNVVQKSANEFSSSCPECGGRDRFVILISSHKGTPFAFCRQDSKHIWFPNRHMDKRDVEELRRLQIEVEEERIKKAEASIAVLQNEKAWERFYKQHNEWSMSLLMQRGFKSEGTIDYLQIGFEPQYQIWYMDDGTWESYYSPSHTIPIWTCNDKVNDIKVRVLNPRDAGRDRYRSHAKTFTSNLYVPGHSLGIEDKVLVVEGEFKAGVVWENLSDSSITVVGVQSKKPDPKVFEAIKGCSTVYLGLDPDAFQKTDKDGISAVEYCAGVLGKERVAVVEFPCKPDDGIAEHNMNIMRYIQMARSAR